MARIVLTSFGSFGDVNPYIGLGLALKARGHVPVLAMPQIYRDMVEAEGLEFRGVRPDLPVDDHALTRRIMDPNRGTEVLFTELILPALGASYEDLGAACGGADLLVTHPATMAGPIVGEQYGGAWASSVLAPMSFFSVSDPVVPPPAPWLHGLLVRSPWLSRTFVKLTHRITRPRAEPVQRFRESLGLGRIANPILDGQHSPHLVLAMFSRVLAEPQPDWPSNVVVTGPLLYNGAASPELRPMKTTLDLDDDLLARAKALAARERTSLTALIVEGLRLRSRPRRRAQGRQAPIQLAIYQGRGGLAAKVDPLSNRSLLEAAEDDA